MRPTILLLGIIFITKLSANEIYLHGIIKNYSQKKITVHYDLNNLVGNSKVIKGTKTDKNGNFQIIITDLNTLSTYNYLNINGERIYFCLNPGDSLFIRFDAKAPQDIQFKGPYSERNIFINDYHNIVRKRIKHNNYATADCTLAYIKRNYKFDSTLLFDYKFRYSIDSLSASILYQEIKYDYFNSLSTSLFDLSNQYLLDSPSFNLQIEHLKYNRVYYSAISGYIAYINHINLNLNSIEKLKYALEYSEEFLEVPYSENYKAYLISFFFLWPYEKRIEKNPEIKDVINRFFSECNDELLIKEIKLLLKNKNVDI